MEKHQAIILFDGVCNLCDKSVQFILKRDKKAYFRFAALQSDEGQERLKELGKDQSSFSSIVLMENGKVYEKSTAALRIARHLSGAWPLLYGFIIVPRFIRDAVYGWIAKNRYRWFGKKNHCMMPKPEWKERFL